MKNKIWVFIFLSISAFGQGKIKPIGVVQVSVGNVRSEPAQSAEMSTQVLLGTPVKILEKADGKNWYFVQMPDDYRGWIEGGAIARMDSLEFKQYKNQGSELIFNNFQGKIHSHPSEKSEIVSELVWLNRLIGLKKNYGFWEVILPTGEKGFVKEQDVQQYRDWLFSNAEPTKNRILQAAHGLIGIPYLWGGTSIKGLDCSGFTKTVFQANGWVLPRDASQQAKEGILVDSTRNWANLAVGDLLFFGEKRSDGTFKVVHVGLWEGNQAYLHASERTRRASMDPNAKEFDAYNLNRYLFTKRIQAAVNQVKSLAKTP
jgi:cell wall-associated NlpC family hydrolase